MKNHLTQITWLSVIRQTAAVSTACPWPPTVSRCSATARSSRVSTTRTSPSLWTLCAASGNGLPLCPSVGRRTCDSVRMRNLIFWCPCQHKFYQVGTVNKLKLKRTRNLKNPFNLVQSRPFLWYFMIDIYVLCRFNYLNVKLPPPPYTSALSKLSSAII